MSPDDLASTTKAGRPTPGFRLLQSPPAPGVRNMAVDDSLMESIRLDGVPTLRFYSWAPACISLGRNQPAAGAWDVDALRAIGVDLVRRPTGGRAILHDRELTYSVVCPSGMLGAPRESYRLINRVLSDAIATVGADVAIQQPTGRHAAIPSNVPCFDEAVPGEILLNGGKLVGSAQLHRDGVMLQHGSILLERSPLLALLERALHRPLEGRCAYLADQVEELPVEKLIAALSTSWEAAVGPLFRSELAAGEIVTADESVSRYATAEWTFRR